jgi:hypothetical protein
MSRPDLWRALNPGMARYHGHPVMLVGQQKGRDLNQRRRRNFGYAQPDGYRKALRAMKLADHVQFANLWKSKLRTFLTAFGVTITGSPHAIAST